MTTEAAPRAALRQIVGASRPLSWINTAYPFGAAYLLAGGRVGWAFVVGVAYFLVPYNLAMYGVNDVFDHASDLANPRKGGVEGVLLADRWHAATLWSALATNLPFVVVLLAVGTASSDAVLAVTLFAVVAYSAPPLRFKERAVLDSVTSSTHFVGPAVFGVALAGGAFSREVVLVLAAYFLWGCASHAFGAVQDVRADRAAGIASIATAFGARATVRLSAWGYAGASVLALGAGWPAALAALVPIPYLLSVLPFRDLDDDRCELAHRGWVRFLWLNPVMGFLVTQALIVAALA
jgi:4-hydroxybenzoate polyprenyltransferase